MFRTSKKLVMTLIGLLLIASLFSSEEGEYAEGTIFFRVYNDFTYINVDNNGIIETDQEWFNLLSNQFSIYEMKHLFSYSSEPDLQYYYSCMFPDTLDLNEVKNTFKAKSGYVEDAYKDIALELYEVPNDEYYNQYYQWPLDLVEAEDAWNIDVPPVGEIIVAVVDTGVDFCDPLDPNLVFNIHPDLTENILKDTNGDPIGYNVFFENRPAYDDI